MSFRLGLSHGLAESVNTLIARADQLGDHDLANRLRRDLILGGADLEQTLSEARLAGPTDEGVTAQSGMLNPVAATTAAPINDLTNRERELLRLLGNGRTNEELAAELYISRRTVDAHLSHIRTKLGVADRVKLAVLARQHIDPDDSVTTPPN